MEAPRNRLSPSLIIQQTHKCAPIGCLHKLAICVSFHLEEDSDTHTSPKCDTWICSSWQKEQVWKAQWWAFVVAENVVTGDREVTQAVPIRSHLALLSDRLYDLGFVSRFPTKKWSFFFLASLAFLQKVSTTYHKIVSHTKSVWHIWNIEKAEGFGGCAFSFKECIMCLELSEMTENYIEGQLHGHFYMFYLIILPVASHCMVLYCIGVDLQLETSYLNPGSLLDPPSVAPHTKTCPQQ